MLKRFQINTNKLKRWNRVTYTDMRDERRQKGKGRSRIIFLDHKLDEFQILDDHTVHV